MDWTHFEKHWWRKGYSYLLGIDEVGRGALAGPVVVGGVIISQNSELILGVDDSKQLSDKKRRQLDFQIRKQHEQVGIGSASQREIDELGIVAAIELAIHRLLKYFTQLDAIMLDGHFSQAFMSSLHIPAKNYIKGDEKSYVIAAASIVAKVYRDDVLIEDSEKYPEYDWKQNKGYGTKQHRLAIVKHGLCEYHRKSFVQNLV